MNRSSPPRKAKALYFSGPGKVELREEELQGGPESVLVRSRCIGISHGTEMLVFRGWLPAGFQDDSLLPSLRGPLAYPLKYGYMNTGVRDAGGKVFAFYPHQDLFYCDPRELIDLPDKLDFEDAVFLANMETALGIVHDACPRYGELVLIVGQGMVGLLVAEILARCGVSRIITVEPYPLRRQASESIGCLALDPGDRVRDRILEHSQGRGVDVAINVSASAEGLQLAIDSLIFQGTVVEASWYGNRSVDLSLGEAFHRKRLKLRSSQVSRIDPALGGGWDKERRFKVVVDLLQAVRPSRYISHRFPLDQGHEAFQLLATSPQQCIQVVLEP